MIQEILISSLGWATIICPECGTRSHTKPGKEFQHKVLERTCKCGAKYQLIFDTRIAPRKECSLPCILSAEETIALEINNLSERGASFDIGELDITVGSVYSLKIKINDEWIDVLVRIIGVNKKAAGFEFVNLGYRQKKIIESFLLSD